MKLNDITSFRLRGHEICKIYKGTNVIFNVCTGSFEWVLKQEINNPLSAGIYENDRFGWVVSVYEDTLVVGAPWDDTLGMAIYIRSGLNWVLQQVITSPTANQYEEFGRSVSLYGDTLVVSAPFDDTGANNAGIVYVYTRAGSTWTLQQAINNPTPVANDEFGNSVSLYQDTLVVGAWGDDTGATNAGSVYIYTRAGSTWSLQQTINNPTPTAYGDFGWSASLYQNTLVVGAPYDDAGATNAGSVYVYTRTGSTWTLQQTINNPTPVAYDEFGGSVSLYEDTLVVGAGGDDAGATNAGSVYVYTRVGSTWSLQQTINNPTPATNDYFGNSVSLYGNTLAVGAWSDSTGADGAGSVYVYTRIGSTWTLQREINNPTPEDDEEFGISVSLYGDTLVVGTPWDIKNEIYGSVYVYNYEEI